MSFSNDLSVKMDDSTYFKTPRVLPKRRSSIFNLDLNELNKKQQRQIPNNLDAYNQKLMQEISDWRKLLKQKNDSIKKLHDQENELDKSILTTSQQEFLNGCIDIVKFADNSREFQDKSFNYFMIKENFSSRKVYYMELLDSEYTTKVFNFATQHIYQSMMLSQFN